MNIEIIIGAIVITVLWIVPFVLSLVIIIKDIYKEIAMDGLTIYDVLITLLAFIMWVFIMLIPIMNYVFISSLQDFSFERILNFKLLKGKKNE